MTLTAALIGLSVLIMGIALGAYLGGKARLNRVRVIDNAQPARTLRAARQLRHNGVWNQPNLSDHDKKHFGL